MHDPIWGDEQPNEEGRKELLSLLLIRKVSPRKIQIELMFTEHTLPDRPSTYQSHVVSGTLWGRQSIYRWEREVARKGKVTPLVSINSSTWTTSPGSWSRGLLLTYNLPFPQENPMAQYVGSDLERESSNSTSGTTRLRKAAFCDSISPSVKQECL